MLENIAKVLSFFEIVFVAATLFLSPCVSFEAHTAFATLWVLPIGTAGITTVAMILLVLGGTHHRGIAHRVVPNLLVCFLNILSAHILVCAEILANRAANASLFGSAVVVALDIVVVLGIIVMCLLDWVRDKQIQSLITEFHGPEKTEIALENLDLANRVISASANHSD